MTLRRGLLAALLALAMMFAVSGMVWMWWEVVKKRQRAVDD